jgi:anthranilate phosphoribosyltransferase
MKGETASELAAAAVVMREHMICWDAGRENVLDTCGTGGDGQGTFNISTATALVVAAAGVPVVKHGNRSATARSGSADVLCELGVGIEADSRLARQCLERTGLAFCFAPLFHPAMRHVAAVRQRLRVPTLFNTLGPLVNPARSSYQLVGVGKMDLVDVMAGALAQLGVRRALVVHGEDGLDEVTLGAATQVRQVRGRDVRAERWTAGHFGLASCDLDDLRATTPAESAALIRLVLQGADLPATRVVLANAAAALLAAERVKTLPEGVSLARDTLATGKAQGVLDALVQVTTCGKDASA